MNLNDLKPTERQRVYDLVREAGLDVSIWANYRRPEHPASNPKYCYSWWIQSSQETMLSGLYS